MDFFILRQVRFFHRNELEPCSCSALTEYIWPDYNFIRCYEKKQKKPQKTRDQNMRIWLVITNWIGAPARRGNTPMSDNGNMYYDVATTPQGHCAPRARRHIITRLCSIIFSMVNVVNNKFLFSSLFFLFFFQFIYFFLLFNILFKSWMGIMCLAMISLNFIEN